MIENTINDDKTAVGGKDVFLAGRYHILRRLGQGGMGSVWLAEDNQLDNRKVAIKMLPSIVVTDKRAYQQLKSEALVSLKLIHPNIVTLRAFEENNGAPFLVMDYIEGRTLSDYLAMKGKLSEAETIKLLKPIAAALDYAHGEKVIHRDVKPSNIIIRNDGHPFILDFGIAREIQESMTRVTGRTISGTLLYMSPEQLRGAPPSPAQDVYSFSAMVYECLKGEPPFVRGEIAYQILNEKPAPLMCARRIADPVLAGLSKKPGSRPKSCSEILCEKSFSGRNCGYARIRSVTKGIEQGDSRPKSILWPLIIALIIGVGALLFWGVFAYSEKRNTDKFLFLFEAKDYDAAAQLIGKIDISDSNVQYRVGEMYFEGNGVTKDKRLAITWYRKAAEQGNARAQCKLGEYYWCGKGVEVNKEESTKWYAKAAEQGDAEGQYNLGYCYFFGFGSVGKSDNYSAEIARLWRKAAEQDFPAAQYRLGDCYEKGDILKDIKKDTAEAVKWYRKAAEHENVDAQNALGRCYSQGKGVVKDMGEAIKWYRRAAEHGSAEAQCAMGNCYVLGNGVETDGLEAMKWYRKAAEQGYADAQFYLGSFYAIGAVVVKDITEATKWYRCAANQGHAAAAEALRTLNVQ